MKLSGLTAQMALAAGVVDSIYGLHGEHATVTSANDSTHSAGSLHYSGCALDFRTHDFEGDRAALVLELRDALGSEFDVVLESAGTDNEHIHVEWDPK